MTLLLVAVGAAIGAPLRYLTDRAVQAHFDSVFPWGTFGVNVAGSLLLGVLVGLPDDSALMALAGSGFCGALTTFSTFSYETLCLVEEKAHWYAAANVLVSVSVCLGAAFCGVALAQAVTG